MIRIFLASMILMVAVWHALFDLLTASKAGQDIIPIITSAGVIVWALVVANINRPWGFRFQQKQVVNEDIEKRSPGFAYKGKGSNLHEYRPSSKPQ